MGIFLKLSWFFKEQKKSYLLGVLYLLLVAVLNIIPPRIIGSVVDSIQQHQLTIQKLIFFLTALTLVGIGQYLFRYFWRSYIWGSAALLEKTIRTRLVTHFAAMDETFYQKYRIGDLMAHATNDITAVQQVAGVGILTFADSIITGISTIIAMMFFVNWRLTLIAIIPLPLLAVLSRILGNIIHSAYDKAQSEFSTINNKTQESILGIKVIKALGQEQEDINDFGAHVDEVIRANRRANFLDSLFDPVTSLIIGLAYVATIVLGGYFVINNTISIGQLISFISYIGILIWPMFAIGRLFNIIELGSASYDRIQLLLSERSKITEAFNPVTKAPQGNVNYEIGKFKYPDSDEIALQQIKFKIKNGQTLGIVGKTGAGKSTILKLLLRQFDSYDGSIKVDNVDIRDYKLDVYLPSIGYVPQNSILFSTTIFENIRFAKPNASTAEVENAAFIADLHDDILKLPDGYQTQVGEQGISLSGGQKQRLAIARALILNPEILILDDSLSAVDAKTENHILRRVKRLRADKTTIIVASRLSSVMSAQEIIVIKDGRIAQRGTHKSLINEKGWYEQTYEMQQLEQQMEGGDK
ncbi:ABC transporter ATP-binding protein [Liquorilactobacillus mali]|uniref:Multidrug ABC transporter ATPase permease n=2 Tax=Liquorilactobacillus mali TaxID=1618 RepID=A0A0R2E4M2_9LACO|nr:ABC transporter transmembrane domain-containing protein [Liquorilactobacillus mali]KRN11378.1 multidrug ABC transporter ATPase permease [Liquorilactobacillus mali KCTC 3596 = DSM 20444]MDC7953116.1 ATP-binding cassette domain-containing protein [Liquorilactobacillus mali]QFQ75287.1 ATP-binding cassette domain-containing protein [Liquorilactobacillus mali]